MIFVVVLSVRPFHSLMAYLMWFFEIATKRLRLPGKISASGCNLQTNSTSDHEPESRDFFPQVFQFFFSILKCLGTGHNTSQTNISLLSTVEFIKSRTKKHL